MNIELTFNEQTHKRFQKSGDKTFCGIQGGIVSKSSFLHETVTYHSLHIHDIL